MNIQTLLEKNETELEGIYESLLDKNPQTEANALRAAYLKEFAFGDKPLVVTDLIDTMLKDEALLITRTYRKIGTLAKYPYLEFEGENGEYSRILAFLIAELVKREAISPYNNHPSSAFLVETMIVSGDMMKRIAHEWLFKLFIGEADVRSRAGMTYYLNRYIEPFIGIEKVIKAKQPITSFEEEYIKWHSESLSDKELFDPIYDSLRQGTIFLMAYHWENNNFPVAKLYAEKFLAITRPDDFLYNVVRFVEKYALNKESLAV